MRILHYFLGFPPYRSGGLTVFCVNLMETQIKLGHTVMGMWPGLIHLLGKQPSIRKRKDYKQIKNYELMNPLPVSLDEGILDVQRFIEPCDRQIYIDFLKKVQPDLIHIHTLMGMHKEFVEAAERLHIKTVFTTHDYFGICPIVTLFRDGHCCDNDFGCSLCANCCKKALSISKIILLQSPLYRTLKESVLLKRMRAKHRSAFYEETNAVHSCRQEFAENRAEDYQKLRRYYIGILENVDVIHFNSTVARDVFQRYFTPRNSRVITISNKEIHDQRNMEVLPSDKIRLTYLSPIRANKGYYIIRKALDNLWDVGKRNFQLTVYGSVRDVPAYMKVAGECYEHSELKKIMLNTDILLAPSVWYETFGFTVLEALSFGVPVIISDRVGAKDIVGKGGIVIAADSVSALEESVKSLSKKSIMEMKQQIVNTVQIKEWKQFVAEFDTFIKE